MHQFLASVYTMNSANLLVFNGAGETLQMIERTLPGISPGEIIVRNLYTTLCGSDLHTFCGLRQEKTPTVLGHEIVGEVVEIGEGHSGLDYAGNPLGPGDIVTWCIFSSDPQSDEARRRMPQKASALFKYGHAQVTEHDAFHGGLAEYCILKENTAILRIPEGVPLDVAATINCAVATVAGALRLAGDVRGRRVLITGLGLLGIVCAAMCRDQGAGRIFTADINADRLRHSLDFGADETFLLASAESAHCTECSPHDIDIAFDMSGAPDAMELGTRALRVGGTAVWIGAVFHARPVQVDAEQVVRKLLTLKGLHNYNYEDFAFAVDFIGRCHSLFPFDQIVGKEFVLPDAQAAFEYALKYKPLRVGIRF